MKDTTVHFLGILGFSEHTELCSLWFSSIPLCLLESDVKAPHLDLPGFKPNPLGLLSRALLSLHHVLEKLGSVLPLLSILEVAGLNPVWEC